MQARLPGLRIAQPSGTAATALATAQAEGSRESRGSSGSYPARVAIGARNGTRVGGGVLLALPTEEMAGRRTRRPAIRPNPGALILQGTHGHAC